MDQIPLWSDQLGHQPIEVPYLCDARFRYDDLGFLNYPLRVGVDTTTLFQDIGPKIKLRDSGAFLQAWLWFGLLGEALRVGSRETTAPKRLGSAAFTKVTGDRKYLSAQSLQACIRADLAMHMPPSYRQFQTARIASCVQVATSFIRNALPSKFCQDLLTEHTGDRESLDIMHLLLACQILCEMLVESYEIGIEDPITTHPQERQPLDIVNYLLRQSGWCPRQIEEMPKMISFRYYLSFCHNKTRCSYFKEEGKANCRCVLSKEPKPLPRHTLKDCSCIQVEVSSSDVNTATQENKITLCRFRSQAGGQISLEVQNMEELGETPYIAISHVRSAGLGNSSANALPLCQVALLQATVDEVGKTFGMGPQSLFWIDTLCLPSDRDLQIATLTAARHIFAMAKAVLVLDPPLYLHTFSSTQEALTRIRYSTWKERLWTLEEGSTAQYLVFRFSHGTVTLEDLLKSMEAAPPDDLLKLVIRKDQPWHLAHKIPERQDLPRLVNRFADDIQAMRRRWWDIQGMASLDEQKLKRVLRLGYLASPVFRYFVQEDEYRGILAIWEPLLRIYGGPGFEDRKAMDRGTDLENVLNRLMAINSIQLSG